MWEAGATMIRTDRLGELDARYRDRVWTFRDTESAAKEAKLVEELLSSADLRSPTAPEVRSVGQTSNVETPHGQVTWQAASPSAPRQPEEQAVTVSPSEYSAPASAVPTFIDTTTMIRTDRLGELDARYRDRVWTFRDTESAAKEAKLVEELLSSADLRSP